MMARLTERDLLPGSRFTPPGIRPAAAWCQVESPNEGPYEAPGQVTSRGRKVFGTGAPKPGPKALSKVLLTQLELAIHSSVGTIISGTIAQSLRATQDPRLNKPRVFVAPKYTFETNYANAVSALAAALAARQRASAVSALPDPTPDSRS
jgi:hypothetical protein